MADRVPGLVAGADMDAPDLLPFAGGEAVVLSARAPGREGSNEDSALLVTLGPGHGVLAVADGAGGLPGGELASRAALEILAGELAGAGHAGGPRRPAILNAFERANDRLPSIAPGAGTTLVVAEIRGGRLRGYHTGDSRLLVTGQRGRLKLLTVSHSPVGYAVESGMLSERAAMRHDDRHLVSNLIGTSDMRIEIGAPLALAPRDTVVLGSDGLFDCLRTDELVETVRRGSLARAAGTLLEIVHRRMHAGSFHPDDVTFILARGVQSAHG